MQLTLAFLLAAPLTALAGPLLEQPRGVKPNDGHPVPSWAKNWNGKCTSTKYATKTVTSTSKITRHPRPTTKTVIVVRTIKKTTTLPQVTDTFSTTSTAYTTTTETQSTTLTDTVTETKTEEIAPSTSYIPASAGFTPIHSVYPTSQPIKRDLLDARHKAPAKPQPTCVKPGDLKCRTTSYKTVTKKTVTRWKTSVVTARRQTSTKSRTNTITTTISVLPSPAKATATFSTTSTVAETTTSTAIVAATTTTSTDVIVGPTPTAYAACGPDNILGQVNGAWVDILWLDGSVPGGGSVYLGNKASAYDCCVACLNTPDCAGAAYLSGSCVALKPDVSCDGSAVSGNFDASTRSDPGWRVSNGYCGQWRKGAP